MVPYLGLLYNADLLVAFRERREQRIQIARYSRRPPRGLRQHDRHCVLRRQIVEFGAHLLDPEQTFTRLRGKTARGRGRGRGLEAVHPRLQSWQLPCVVTRRAVWIEPDFDGARLRPQGSHARPGRAQRPAIHLPRSGVGSAITCTRPAVRLARSRAGSAIAWTCPGIAPDGLGFQPRCRFRFAARVCPVLG